MVMSPQFVASVAATALMPAEREARPFVARSTQVPPLSTTPGTIPEAYTPEASAPKVVITTSTTAASGATGVLCEGTGIGVAVCSSCGAAGGEMVALAGPLLGSGAHPRSAAGASRMTQLRTATGRTLQGYRADSLNPGNRAGRRTRLGRQVPQVSGEFIVNLG